MGNTTRFTYETKRIKLPGYSDTIYIGQRVSAIETVDASTGRKKLRRFSYAKPGITIDVTKLDYNSWVGLTGVHLTTDNPKVTVEHNLLTAVQTANPRTLGLPVQSTQILYGQVTEDVTGTGLDHPLRTVYEYDLTPACHDVENTTRATPTPPLGYGLQRLMGVLNRVPGDTANAVLYSRLFSPKPVTTYIMRKFGGRPLLIKRTVMESTGGGFREFETQRNVWRQTTPTIIQMGAHCESLVYDEMDGGSRVSGITDPVRDVSAFSIYATSSVWLCDSVITRRHYPDGNCREIKEAMTYGPADGNLSIATSGLSGYKTSHSLPHQLLRTDYISGNQRMSRTTMRAANRPGTAGHPSMPLIERIIAGGDTIDRVVQYHNFGGVPRLARTFTRVNGHGPVKEQTFTSYNAHGLPLNGTDENGVPHSWTWDQNDCISSVTKADSLTTRYTHIPLLGCTGVYQPSGKTRKYEYTGGRISKESNGHTELSTFTYGLHAETGRNFIEETSRTTDWNRLTVRTDFDGQGLEFLRCEPVSGGYVAVARQYDAIGRTLGVTVPTGMSGTPSKMTFGGVLSSSRANVGAPHPLVEYDYGFSPLDTPGMTINPGQDSSEAFLASRLCNSTTNPLLKCNSYTLDGTQLVDNGSVPAGELDVVKTTDPDGVTVLTFTDWRGLKVLERRVLSESGKKWLDTYNVHDASGRLRMTIMPKFHDTPRQVLNSINDRRMVENSYIYSYDRLGRLTSKRLPGGPVVNYRYDTRGRLAFSQDAVELNEGKCRFYLYDRAGRTVIEGLANATRMPAPDSISPAATARLDLSAATPGIDGTGYFADSLAFVAGRVLKAYYYDTPTPHRLPGFSSLPGRPATVNSGNPTGLLQGVRERVLRHTREGLIPEAGTDSVAPFIYTLYLYDSEERPTLTARSTTRPGEYLETRTVYDVAGNITAVNNTLHHPDGTTHREITSTQYDNKGRPTRLISSAGGATATVATVAYDIYGRPVLGSGAAGATRTAYDIASRPVGLTTEAFSETYAYTPAGRLDRRITEPVDGATRRRFYSYDPVGRLVSVSNPIEGPTSPDQAYESETAYDSNSNPTAIRRLTIDTPWLPSQPLPSDPEITEVDDLTLTYVGNRLVNVEDAADDPVAASSYDFISSPLGVDIQYTYDRMGRLVSDANRGIEEIEWNDASMPGLVAMDNGYWIEYLYSASGERLGMAVRTASAPSSDDATTRGIPGTLLSTAAAGGGAVIYPPQLPATRTLERRRWVGPFEVVGDSVARIEVSGGYWAGGVMHGYITDRRGDVRAVRRADTGAIVQLTDYFPYGAPSRSVNPEANTMKFNGKEFETRYGLNFTYHGARLYSPAEARFLTPDPFAEVNPGVSPYLYCSADPINFTDPTGLFQTAEEAYNYALDNLAGYHYKIHLDKDRNECYFEIHPYDDRIYNEEDGKYFLSLNKDPSVLTVLGFYERPNRFKDITVNIAEAAAPANSTVDILFNLGKNPSDGPGVKLLLKTPMCVGLGISVISFGNEAVETYNYIKKGGNDSSIMTLHVTNLVVTSVTTAMSLPLYGPYTPLVNLIGLGISTTYFLVEKIIEKNLRD